jgi:hypothetical protein
VKKEVFIRKNCAELGKEKNLKKSSRVKQPAKKTRFSSSEHSSVNSSDYLSGAIIT